ncbi:DMP19 family protein [Flavobacterium sp. NPDC079362]|uniref:DMP19 family protein n=1 Tax=Flavobacterium sp. NPDC079362 TaxID=3390566 RepID=UPI003D06EE6E
MLSVLGCSPNGKKNDKKITQSIEEFNNKKIYTKLSEEIIDNTSDDKLLQLVFDNLSQKNFEDYENEFANVMSWNKSKQAIYMIWTLESEVNNGGYNQFYFNSSGQFYKYLPDALKLVGANKYAELTKRGNEIFEKENPKITQHQDGTIEGFSKSYEDNPLNKFDEEFYKLYETENLQQLQVDFIIKHKTEFIDN